MGTDRFKKDRLRSVRIQGFRSVADLTVELGGLQVLIGENGTGKSTIIEAFEILRKTVTEPRFVHDLASRHGAIQDLKRRGADALRLSAEVLLVNPIDSAIAETSCRYSISLSGVGDSGFAVIVAESLDVDGVPLVRRDVEGTRVLSAPTGPDEEPMRPVRVPPEMTAIASLWGLDAPPEVLRLRRALESIRVHVPFDTRPRWSQPSDREVIGMRSITQMEPVTQLERGGANLTSVFQKLHEKPTAWAAVLRDVQAGLGLDVEDVAITVKQRGGYAELGLAISGAGLIPASQLSDGQLSYLGIVALAHLREEESVLFFDEPELHLHPGLLVRATWLFERIAERQPVILATHADAVLDALKDESQSVRVVDLDEHRQTHVRGLSSERLKKWSEQYSSVSALRREGLLSDVVEASQ